MVSHRDLALTRAHAIRYYFGVHPFLAFSRPPGTCLVGEPKFFRGLKGGGGINLSEGA